MEGDGDGGFDGAGFGALDADGGGGCDVLDLVAEAGAVVLRGEVEGELVVIGQAEGDGVQPGIGGGASDGAARADGDGELARTIGALLFGGDADARVEVVGVCVHFEERANGSGGDADGARCGGVEVAVDKVGEDEIAHERRC